MKVTVPLASALYGNHCRRRGAHFAPVLAMLLTFLCTISAQSLTPTSITLASFSGTVTAGTAITLTATVSTGAGNVNGDQVAFCDATATYCTDIHRLATVQIIGATATYKFIPGPGTHSYKAIFLRNTIYAASTSSNISLTVTPKRSTATSIALSGNAGSYSELSVVSGVGAIAPTGTISILDTSNANYVLGTGTLVSNPSTLNFSSLQLSSTGGYPGAVAAGDFNGDGKPDLAIVNVSTSLVTILLGNGDGTFTSHATLSGFNNPNAIVTGDFNNDGILDLAVINNGTSAVWVMFGTGGGNFGSPHVTSVSSNPSALAVADFNNDGTQDLVVTSTYSNSVDVLLGDGSGTFSLSGLHAVGNDPTSVAVADFNNDGNQDIVVTNYNDSTVTVLFGNGSGNISSTVTLGAFGASYSVVNADFNGDGNQDFAVADYAQNTVIIFLGRGDGTFTSASAATGYSPYALAVADFNGDGIPDLVAVDAVIYSGSVSILLGNGDGTFQGYSSAAADNDPRSVAVADFNGDGFSDIVAANYLAASATVFLAQPTQSASATVSNLVPVGTGSHQVVASYPGDSNFAASTSSASTLAATRTSFQQFTLSASPASSVSGQQVTLSATASPYTAQNHTTDGETIIFNTFPGGNAIGTGTLSGGVATLRLSTLPVGTSTIQALYSGDANFYSDASNDISYTVASITSTTLTIASGSTAVASVTSGIVVTLTATVASGTSPISPGLVAFCDAAAPHCTDIHRLSTAQLSSAGIATLKLTPAIGSHSYKAVFLGTTASAVSASSAAPLTVTGLYSTSTTLASSGSSGNYTLTATVTTPARTGASGAVTFIDTTNANAVLGSAMLGASAYSFSLGSQQTLATAAFPKAVATGDFNADGKPDFIIANFAGNSLTVGLGQGDGTFLTAPFSATLANPDAIAVGDFNGDGKQDLAVTNYGNNTVSIFLGNGDGSFAPGTPVHVGNLPYAVVAGDFNNDGKQDLAIANAHDNTVTILLGVGGGTFTNTASTGTAALSTGNNPQAIVTADFNNDGNQDLAVSNLNDGTITVFFGDGSGAFPSSVAVPALGDSFSLAVADLDADGNADLIALNSSGTTATILRGNGSGAFTPLASPATGAFPISVAIADLNGDGIPDIVTANDNANNTLTLLLGNGDGTFQPTIGYATGITPQAVALADFNGDGYGDLVTANYDTNNASVLLAQPLQTATAAATGISPTGTPGGHLVQASYPGDSVHSSSTSNIVTLTPLPYAAAPTFSPAPAAYTSAQTVTLATTPPSASIFYTIDGSTPTTSSTPYTAPISVTASEIIKAIAAAANYQTSAPATGAYTINYPPNITSQPASQTLNSGATATLTVSATGPAPLTYQWYSGTSPNTTSPIAGATSSIYTTPALTSTSSFWVQVNNASAVPANSVTATITVITPPTITAQSQNSTINSGQSATLSVTATGTSPAYQWYSGTSPSTASPIAGAVSSAYITPTLTANASFWVQARNLAGSANSSTFLITVNQPPSCTLTVQPTSTSLTVIATSSCSNPQSQPLTQTIVWGDATTSSVNTATGTNSHTYATAGIYTVVLSAAYTSGLTGTATQRISPSQSPVCTLGVVQGQISTVLTQYPVSVTGGCTDPQGQPLTLSLNWGDGATVTPGASPYTHTYSSATTITYNIVLTATDTPGLTGSSAPQPVQIVPAQTIGVGDSAPIASAISPPTLSPPASLQVYFVCSSVSVQVNGQTMTTLPSIVGISCISPSVTLTTTPTPVNVTITTSTGPVAALRSRNSTLALCGLACPFLGLAFLLPLAPRKRRRLTAITLACFLCLSLCSCGGYFQPPAIAATPPGLYYITLVETVVPPQVAPTGFIQTSLIIRLPVTP